MTSINLTHLQQSIATYLQTHLNAAAWQWLEQRVATIRSNSNPQSLVTAFAQVSRKVNVFIIDDELPENPVNLQMKGWDSICLVRVFLLMQVVSDDRDSYKQQIGNLFRYADMDESVALYVALPVLAYPEEWVHQCTEGLRSNISYVHDAIMQNNPWPARYLPEAAWNQLVLKAFFNEKDMNRVIGLQARNNQELVLALTDYRAERLAAGRPIHPGIEQLIASFKTA
ncbi:EboA domain-containing protein [Cellvibrio polysaccharolyticus]|uniref:Uncharacterized protein n=1 Tax=Cellvibrio polysaccharolyticus TaxID=2082724 RepID=A0A928V773_9GAMM|nr:EboA domain-containing protein [Cellvibrio polysaccharolyticus]MBE8718191.1 hypothetical protein [Cellvibrio polysaccharolyticus]